MIFKEVDSVIGFQRGVELQAVVYGASVLCYGVETGAGGVVDYEDVVHGSRIKGYVFWIQEEFYVGLFKVL